MLFSPSRQPNKSECSNDCPQPTHKRAGKRKDSKTQCESLSQSSVYLGLRGPLHVHARTCGRERELSREGKRMDLGWGPAGLEHPARPSEPQGDVSCPTSAHTGAQGSKAPLRAAELSTDFGVTPLLFLQHSATRPEVSAQFQRKGDQMWG